MASSTKRAGSAAGRRSRRSRPSPRQRLLDGATRLFTTEGIRVIGIDRILREADVAKASLYSLFGSKDALVVAYLEELDRKWREAWAKRTENAVGAEDRILAFFDQHIETMPGENYRGSHFQNAAGEYPLPETDAEHAIIAAARAHRRWCRETITALLEERNGYPSGDEAEAILIHLDGGIAGSKLQRDVHPLRTARELTRQLLAEPVADYSI